MAADAISRDGRAECSLADRLTQETGRAVAACDPPAAAMACCTSDSSPRSASDSTV